jgi:tetratricopeptide (TPR) repeat protein
MHDDIELPWMNNLAGELMIVCERYADAAVYLERSLKLAEDFGLLAEQIDSHTLIGRVYLQSGNYEKAYASFRRAFEIARKISERISNPDDQNLFQNRPTIKFLMIEIKKLAKSLSTKKQAGA